MERNRKSFPIKCCVCGKVIEDDRYFVTRIRLDGGVPQNEYACRDCLAAAREAQREQVR